MTISDVPRPPNRHQPGQLPWPVSAATIAAILTITIVILFRYGGSPDYRAASGFGGPADTGSATSETGGIDQSTLTPTATPSPGISSEDKVATIHADVPTPYSTRAPRSTEVPIPTCPAQDQNDRDRICSIPTPTRVPPTPGSTATVPVYAVPTCGTHPIDACRMEASDGD